MTRPRYPRSQSTPFAKLSYLPALFLLLAVGAHAQTPTPPQPITALVHGSITSQTYQYLSSHLSLTQDDGQQNASNFDVLIFEGNAEPDGGQDTALSTEISEALGNNHWVLAFDADQKVKTSYLAPVIYFSSPGRSRSYLVRSVTEPDGTSSWRIVTSPLTLPGGPTLNSENDIASDDAQSLLTRLQDPQASLAPVAVPQQGSNVQPGNDTSDPLQPDNPIPPGLIHARWYLTVEEGPVALPQPAKRSNAAKQYLRMVVNATYTAFLNNDKNASGDFQFVLVQLDGSFNPTNGTNYFANMTKEERAWFDDRMTVILEPAEAANPLYNLSWINNAPINPNPTTTYSASSGFTVGFSGLTGALSYTWGTSKTFEIPSWKVSSNGAGSKMNWSFRSASPDADVAYNKCSNVLNWFNDCGPVDNGYPNSDGSPNQLSLLQNVFHTAVVYRTQGVRSGQFGRALLMGSVRTQLPDLYCAIPLGLLCGSDPAWAEYYNITPINTIIDLSAVVPVPIQHMTFSQNPAVAGRKISGQVFLETPAPIDTTVFLTSIDPSRAKPPASVVIKKGTNNSPFDILTSPAGNPGLDTVFIDASYAGTSLTEALQIRTYGQGDLMPPSTVVTTNPNDWTANLPIGKWVSGFMVRYAVSYVDAQGNETDRGPWTPWFTNSTRALPVLFNVPLDASHRAVERKIYRQFYADVDNANPEGGVELVGQLADNTTTQFTDQSAN
jgi:hypothetical protein